MVSEDVEFYHDRGGPLTSKKGLVLAQENNICGKVNRELLSGSIEVSDIAKYGAVQIVWRRQDGGWQLTRVLSLD